MPAGRPLKYKSKEQLEEAIEDYFASCFEQKPIYLEDGKTISGYETIVKRPPTISGLALHLDTTRDLLIDYEEKDGYSDTIKKAKLRCMNFAEEQLFGKGNPAGVIFNLKNNYRKMSNPWTDDTTVKLESGNEKLTDDDIAAARERLKNNGK